MLCSATEYFMFQLFGVVSDACYRLFSLCMNIEQCVCTKHRLFLHVYVFIVIYWLTSYDFQTTDFETFTLTRVEMQ